MRSWLALAAFLLFGAGGAVGFLAARGLSGARVSTVSTLPFQDLYTDTPISIIASEDVAKQLALGGDQKGRLDLVLANYHDRLKGLREDLAELNAYLNGEIGSILTADQRRVFFSEIKPKYEEGGIKSWVQGELMSYRVELALTPEQETRAYPILFDSHLERRRCWDDMREGNSTRPSRSEVEKRMKGISEGRDQKLAEVFTAEQMAKYRELKEKRRAKHEKGDKGDKRPRGDERGPGGPEKPPAGDPPTQP
jgi:hypothetical protein